MKQITYPTPVPYPQDENPLYGMYYFDNGTMEVKDENLRYGSYEGAGSTEKGGTDVKPDHGVFATDVNPDYED